MHRGEQTTLMNGIDIGVVNAFPASYQRFSVLMATAAPIGSARTGTSSRRSAPR
jgi:hypothetical protein